MERIIKIILKNIFLILLVCIPLKAGLYYYDYGDNQRFVDYAGQNIQTLYCGADISAVKMSNDTQPIKSIPTIEAIKIPRLYKGEKIGCQLQKTDSSLYRECFFSVNIVIQKNIVYIWDWINQKIFEYSLSAKKMKEIHKFGSSQNLNAGIIEFEDDILYLRNSKGEIIEINIKNSKINTKTEINDVFIDKCNKNIYYISGFKFKTQIGPKKNIDIIKNETVIKQKDENLLKTDLNKQKILERFLGANYLNRLKDGYICNDNLILPVIMPPVVGKHESLSQKEKFEFKNYSLIKYNLQTGEEIQHIKTDSKQLVFFGAHNDELFFWNRDDVNGRAGENPNIVIYNIDTLQERKRIAITTNFLPFDCGGNINIGVSGLAAGVSSEGDLYISGPFDKDYLILYKYNY
ncbi:MAG: hypothetical protein KA120_07500 [Candidatus Goldbacteria bacterium]|nr:hypothetical protein [Candidatus Goldiibacteriota bacterium]